MILDEATLIGYKRFTLSGMNGITIKPSKQLQVIRGTNGCGKSSFLSELSPLPGERKNYIPGGKKVMKYRYHGSTYTLTSSFEDGQHHSFLLNNEELNEGGTITVQKELVKRHFGITQEIHDIMIGKINFNMLSPQDRRRWITAMSQNDYTFAMSLFNHYKTKARDAQAVVKHLGARITHETAKLHGMGNLDGLEDRVSLLNEELRVLLAHRKEGIEQEPFDPTPVLRSLEDDIRYCKEILPYVPIGKSYRGLDDVEQDIRVLEHECIRHQDFKNRYMEEHVSVEDTLQKLQRFQHDQGETITLEEAIGSLKARITDGEAKIQTFQNVEQPAVLLDNIRRALPALVELFNLLPDNTDGRFDKTRLEWLKDKLSTTASNRDATNSQLNRLEYKIEAFENLHEITCPSCEYVWKPGFNESEHSHLHEEASKLREQLRTFESQIEKGSDVLHQVEEVTALYRELRVLVNAYAPLQPLWDVVLARKLHMTNPQSAIPLFYQFEHDVAIQADLAEMRHELTELEALKLNPEASSELGYLYARLNDLHNRIIEHKDAYQRATHELAMIHAYYERLMNLSDCLRTIEEKVNIIRSRTSQEIERLRNVHIDRAMANRHSELGSVQTILQDKVMVTTILEDLQQSFTESEKDALITKTLARAMSPTEGVTADQLMTPLRAICTRVNAIVAKVWTYEMMVLPCRPQDEGELDYNFPIDFPEQGKQSPDIAQGSKSQMAMINYAFRLVIKHYLKLHDYPYFLDEMEDGFDDVHRPALVGLIQFLMETHPATQLFMVSHYYSTYGSLASSQICVLDDTNISVPEAYNEHVTFL
jgi:hypothetical protein